MAAIAREIEEAYKPLVAVIEKHASRSKSLKGLRAVALTMMANAIGFSLGVGLDVDELFWDARRINTKTGRARRGGAPRGRSKE